MHNWIEKVSLVFCLFLCSLTASGENDYPAICITNANLNIRESGSMHARILETLEVGTKVQVYRISSDGWAEIDYYGDRAYCSNEYLTYWEALPTESFLSHSIVLIGYSAVWQHHGCKSTNITPTAIAETQDFADS